ncbi:Leucine-rich repeat, cysteine-containing subtype [Corchorus olitorius]|uniref:Leucine-rich repeat, cysteine-containing subtype n=1 Tax=Corchorus olitorius TaxID=93759 RepID=A0A1R3JA94_9ROSI|nr:Leucine-rich repeat, cysteine-containing subtype [Corchorus olitorius]
MPVLRSREIPPVPPKNRKTRAQVDPPTTPTQCREQPAAPPSLTPSPITPGRASHLVPARRRSLRLASKAYSSVEQEEDDVSEQEKRVGRRNGAVSKKRKLTVDGDGDFQSEENKEGLSLRSGKRVVKTSSLDDGVGDEKVESDKKGKKVLQEEPENSEKLEGTSENVSLGSRRRFSREEKGKGKLVVETGLESKAENSVDNSASGVDLSAEKVTLPDENPSNKRRNEGRRQQYRDVARENASRFAHFDAQEEDDSNISSVEAEREIPSEEEKPVEDWPGPFSTAMKIIRDRAEKLNVKQGSSSENVQSVQIKWVPQKGKGKDERSKRLPPSLIEMCIRVLVNNADAIASLDLVPDVLRHKLCQMLCDSRRMDCNFLNLLVSGSPTEIRLRDCSWLKEEEFSKCFEGCDTTNLTVLQLDQCGSCMADYIILSTLARSTNNLPALTSMSLSGAYRLSDAGLNALISSAPALRSINLNECSLLTSCAIDSLAKSLGSVLRELYINDCQCIDAMLILPALKKLEHLEVLAVGGLESVTDGFIKEFIVERGYGIKELIFTGCGKLSDSSFKIIAETCSDLRALDISNVSKLTDSTLGYLANGCQSLQSLKLCRNAFSDDAIAAFLETSGENLKELSLNNVGKVGQNTALSLARRGRNLISLDLSWCRNLTDEAVGLIVDSCLSLRALKLFGCSQITNVFLSGHSNSNVEIIGSKLSPLLEHIKVSHADV